MKIHRLIQITALPTYGEPRMLSSIQDVVDLRIALDGCDNWEEGKRRLLAGESITFDQQVAGVRIHGRLYADNVPNNETLGRLKRGSRRGKAVARV